MPKDQVARLHEQTAARVRQAVSDLFASGQKLDEIGRRVQDVFITIRRLRGLVVDPNYQTGLGPSHITDGYLKLLGDEIGSIAASPHKPAQAVRAVEAAYHSLNEYLDGVG